LKSRIFSFPLPLFLTQILIKSTIIEVVIQKTFLVKKNIVHAMPESNVNLFCTGTLCSGGIIVYIALHN
jgi:hypothetical protein